MCKEQQFLYIIQFCTKKKFSCTLLVMYEKEGAFIYLDLFIIVARSNVACLF